MFAESRRWQVARKLPLSKRFAEDLLCPGMLNLPLKSLSRNVLRQHATLGR
jgi:hypothetical protein